LVGCASSTLFLFRQKIIRKAARFVFQIKSMLLIMTDHDHGQHAQNVRADVLPAARSSSTASSMQDGDTFNVNKPGR